MERGGVEGEGLCAGRREDVPGRGVDRFEVVVGPRAVMYPDVGQRDPRERRRPRDTRRGGTLEESLPVLHRVGDRLIR